MVCAERKLTSQTLDIHIRQFGFGTLEYLGAPPAPAVDGLLHVADDEDRAGRTGALECERAQDIPLCLTGILELVEQQMVEGAVQATGGLGRITQHSQEQARHVGEQQEAFGAPQSQYSPSNASSNCRTAWVRRRTRRQYLMPGDVSSTA